MEHLMGQVRGSRQSRAGLVGATTALIALLAALTTAALTGTTDARWHDTVTVPLPVETFTLIDSGEEREASDRG